LEKVKTLVNRGLNGTDIDSFKIDTGAATHVILRDMLFEAYTEGNKEGQSELPDSVVKGLPKTSIMERTLKNYAGFQPVEAQRYLDAKALTVKGVIDSDLLKQTKFKLLEFLKGGKSIQEISDDIRLIFEPYVGDPTKILPSGQVGIGFPPGEKAPENVLMAYRLENIVRTNTTDAYNQGRLSIAEDAGDYVVGMMYSAILDERTSEICKELDQLMVRKSDARLPKITPPAHFQCRSLWVYITADDLPVEWTSDAALDKALRIIPDEFQ
jgi:SPP1 gp7 family putative phage head morphogenesis protein